MYKDRRTFCTKITSHYEFYKKKCIKKLYTILYKSPQVSGKVGSKVLLSLWGAYLPIYIN